MEPKFRKATVFIALTALLTGILFTLLITISSIWNFGITWKFDAIVSGHIATFIAGVAGTLFTLGSAILLYATLMAQHEATQKLEHGQQRQDQQRRYDRLLAQVEAMEAQIRDYRIKVSNMGKDGKWLSTELVGGAAWEQAFDYWVSASFPSGVWAGLELGQPIEPDEFLHDQTTVLDLLTRLTYATEDIQRLEIEIRDKGYLLKRVNLMINRLAKHKARIRSARDLLRTVVDDGISGVEKAKFVSPLLHVIGQINEALDLLPDITHRILTPYEGIAIVFKKTVSEFYFESIDVPTVQIDRLSLKTEDANWAFRLALSSIQVEMEATEAGGRQVCYQRMPFNLGVLYSVNTKELDFDTRGEWVIEGKLNPNVRLAQHQNWNARISIEGLELSIGEELVVNLYTNMQQTTSGKFVGIRG